MKIKPVTFLISLVFAVVFLLLMNSRTLAQFEIGAGWSEPLNLSDSPYNFSGQPAVVADDYGGVHVFWSESMGEDQESEAVAFQLGNTILYRRLKDGIWSDAIDIFYGANSRLEDPWAAIDNEGVLHLVWLQNGGLRYSYAPVLDADKVRSWALPVIISRGWVGQARLMNVDGQILVVYSLIAGDNAGLYTVQAGESDLPLPTQIWTSSQGLVPQDISVALDGKGRLHAVWSITQPPNVAALSVYYSKSEDGGASWSEARLVADSSSEQDSLQHASPWVAAHGEDEIHLQWAQGEQTYRWHQMSKDGGKTWGRPYQIWDDLISQTRSLAVGEDSDGRLYWADVLRFPNGAYLIQWTGREWQRPELFFSIFPLRNDVLEYRINVHGIRMVIANGNELHVVFKDQDRGEVWYMHRTLPARSIPPIAMPVATSQPSPTPTSLALPAAIPLTPTPLYFLQQDASADIANRVEKPMVSLLAGVLPVLLLISAIAIKRMKRE